MKNSAERELKESDPAEWEGWDWLRFASVSPVLVPVAKPVPYSVNSRSAHR